MAYLFRIMIEVLVIYVGVISTDMQAEKYISWEVYVYGCLRIYFLIVKRSTLIINIH